MPKEILFPELYIQIYIVYYLRKSLKMHMLESTYLSFKKLCTCMPIAFIIINLCAKQNNSWKLIFCTMIKSSLRALKLL